MSVLSRSRAQRATPAPRRGNQAPASWAATATETFASTATYAQSVATWQATASEAFPSSATWATGSGDIVVSGSQRGVRGHWLVRPGGGSVGGGRRRDVLGHRIIRPGGGKLGRHRRRDVPEQATWVQAAASWDAAATATAARPPSPATWDAGRCHWAAIAGYVPCDEFSGELGAPELDAGVPCSRHGGRLRTRGTGRGTRASAATAQRCGFIRRPAGRGRRSPEPIDSDGRRVRPEACRLEGRHGDVRRRLLARPVR